VSQDDRITVRFHSPPEDLQGCFTSFYCTEIDPGDAGTVRDSLHPEWAGLRFFSPRAPTAWIEGSEPLCDARFVLTGPTTRPIHFIIPRTRIWGIGLLPLGWARFVGEPATSSANRVLDGLHDPIAARFVPLAETLFGDPADEAVELERIIAFFRALPPRPVADERRIQAIHAALVDPEVDGVARLTQRVAASQRTVERLCHRHFGFSPKLLLRRQRFMRSLTQFMLDPSLKWIGAIDSQYHDQAQFVHDFREFMGTTPREYAATPHPVLQRFVEERNRVRGAAVQTLDRPAGTTP